MSRGNFLRLRRLEKTGNRVTDWRYMTDEQLLEAACDYDPAVMSTVMPAFRAGGLAFQRARSSCGVSRSACLMGFPTDRVENVHPVLTLLFQAYSLAREVINASSRRPHAMGARHSS